MTTYYAAVHDGRVFGIGFDAKGARKDAARRSDAADFAVHEITPEQCKRIASANEAPAWPLDDR
jgi:hypothetical protein